jgi:hypothetical protein
MHWTKRSRQTGESMDQKKRGKFMIACNCYCHVSYQFCGLSADIVHARDEAEARTKAVDQLRARGLKVALATHAAAELG